MNDKSLPASILICSIRVIGDVILSTPLIGILSEAYPLASIDVMVAAGSGDFLRRDPRIRNVIESPTNEIGEDFSNKSSRSKLSQIFRQYDLSISLNASDRGNIAAILAGRKQRISFYEDNGFIKNFWKKLLLSKPLLYDTSCHTVHMSKLIAEALRIKADHLEVKIYWNDADNAAVKHVIGSCNLNRPYFVIHPFARWDYKFWPMQSFIELSDKIAERYGIQPVWTASPAPSELECMAIHAPKCAYPPITVCGTLSINQMACLIAGSSLYIGLDTAISHLAASTGVPMIALYGPTATHRWFPWNNTASPDQLEHCQRGRHRNGHIVLLQKECQHPGCIREKCDRPCLPRILPEEVFAEAAMLLEERGLIQTGEILADK